MMVSVGQDRQELDGRLQGLGGKTFVIGHARFRVMVDLEIWRAAVRIFDVVVEQDPDTRLYVGYVPGWPGAHSQADTLAELQANLKEVIELLLEEGEPKLESAFVGLQRIQVA